MGRKLASIQRVKSVEPIPGADLIDKVTFTSVGWQCVVMKGEFQEGDLGVYIEIDSVVPECQDFEFLRPKKFRVRTLKLKGTLSQGLMVPLAILGETGYTLDEGEDVTELLGITKYEPPVPISLEGQVVGKRPGFVYKTEEIRVQSEPALLEELTGKEVYISTKIDGTSMSVFFVHNPEDEEEGSFGVCGRRYEMKPSDKCAYWRAARKLDLYNKLSVLNCESIVIQGELAGPGINKNRPGLKDTNLFVFNVWVDGKFVGVKEMVTVCEKLGLNTVPIEEVMMFEHSLEWLLERAKGKYAGTNNEKEGIVIRPTTPCLSPLLGFRQLSVKIINNNFLLKEK